MYIFDTRCSLLPAQCSPFNAYHSNLRSVNIQSGEQMSQIKIKIRTQVLTQTFNRSASLSLSRSECNLT
jgi:hypothetical protein